MDFYPDFAPQSTPVVAFYNSEASSRAALLEEGSVSQTQTLQARTARDKLQDINAPSRLLSSGFLRERRRSDTTGLLADREPVQARPVENALIRNNDDEAEKIAASRLRLMAIKYAADAASPEILARLEILNSRLLNSRPRISAEQLSKLEDSIDKLNGVEQSRLARAKRLGLNLG